MIDDMAGLYTVTERVEKCGAVQEKRTQSHVQTEKFSDYPRKTPLNSRCAVYPFRLSANRVRVEETIANEQLYNLLKKRYGLKTDGAVDYFEFRVDIE